MDTIQKNREPETRRHREAAPSGAVREDRPHQEAPQKQRPREARQDRPRQERTPAKTQQAPRREGEGKALQPAKPRQAPAKRRRREVPDDLSATKRAYGKTKPRKKTVIDRMSDLFLRSMERNEAKKKAKEEAILKGASRPRKKTVIPPPTVIYTQPQAFNRSRMVIQLATVTAVVLALVLGLSVFFRVGEIEVTGADVYTAWSVREASGINEGDGLLTFSRARAGALIKAKLPYVENVSFGIKLPDTVNIIVKEESVVYAVQDVYSMWWLINSKGRVVEQTTTAKAGNHTQVVGVTLLDPVPDDPAVAAERQAAPLPTETTAAADATQAPTEETIAPVGTTGAEKLNAALRILAALEDNDIVGEAASVDVTHIDDIMLWYGTRYQVKLGTADNLEYKVACMGDVILQMSDYQSGVLDLSFTIWPDKVGYTPFG